MSKAITRTVGCDLGDKYSHVCVLDEAGTVVERARVKTSRAGFDKWFKGKVTRVVALEVGTHSRWVSAQLTELGHEVLVANARQVRLIYAGRRKNDKLDAEALARLARVDRQLLSPIQHRGAQAQAELMVLRSRDMLVKARTELINHVRGVTKSTGLRIASCQSSTFPRRARELLTPELRVAVEPLLQSIEHLSAQIKATDRRIEKMHDDHPEAQLMSQISGVGALTAMATKTP